MPTEGQNGYLTLNLELLEILGLWPRKMKQFSIPHLLKDLVFMVLSLQALVGLFSDLYRQLRGWRDNLDQLFQSINISMSMLFMFGTLFVFCIKRNDIKYVIDNLRDLGIGERPADSDETEKRTRSKMKLGLFVTFLIFVIYIFTPLAFWNSCEAKRATLVHLKYMPCGFFTTLWYPFQFDKFPMYVIVLTGIIVLNLFYVFTMVSLIILPACIILHVIAHIRNLKRKLKNLNVTELQKAELRACITYHQTIIKFSAKLSDCFSLLAFWLLLSGTLLISLIAFQFLMTETIINKLRLILYFAITSTMFFFLNLSGQLLTNESISLSDVIYDLDWDHYPVDIQKDIKMMLQRAQQPLYLSAGPTTILSLQTFSAIMSSTYSYITLFSNFI